MPSHKRGGSYKLQIISNIRNWSGVLLDHRILNNLKIDDIVRVIFESGEKRYVFITAILKNGYFKGYVNDNYSNRYCNICRKEGIIKRMPLYHCENWICDFDCHLECLKKTS